MKKINAKCEVLGTPEQRAQFMASLQRTRDAYANARKQRQHRDNP